MSQILQFPREQNALEPEDLAIAASAYDKAVVDIGNAPLSVREVVAKNIIRLIAEGERNPEVLYERALGSSGIPA